MTIPHMCKTKSSLAKNHCYCVCLQHVYILDDFQAHMCTSLEWVLPQQLSAEQQEEAGGGSASEEEEWFYQPLPAYGTK